MHTRIHTEEFVFIYTYQKSSKVTMSINDFMSAGGIWQSGDVGFPNCHKKVGGKWWGGGGGKGARQDLIRNLNSI